MCFPALRAVYCLFIVTFPGLALPLRQAEYNIFCPRASRGVLLRLPFPGLHLPLRYAENSEQNPRASRVVLSFFPCRLSDISVSTPPTMSPASAVRSSPGRKSRNLGVYGGFGWPLRRCGSHGGAGGGRAQCVHQLCWQTERVA